MTETAADAATHSESRPTARRTWWIAPLGIYLVMRAINALMIALASAHQLGRERWADSVQAFVANAPEAESPYLRVTSNWDGQWFQQIATHGYPTTLPTSLDGEVGQSEWAFLPMFPAVCRGLMATTGLSFAAAGMLVSVVCGAVGVVGFYRLLVHPLGREASLAAVVALCVFPCAPVLQLAYSDGMALALLSGLLLALTSQRHGWVAILNLVLALTRAIALPIALVIAVVAFRRWRQGRLTGRGIAVAALLTCWSLLCALLWPVISGIATGRPDAFSATQHAWGNDLLPPPVVRFVQSFGPSEQWTAIVLACCAVVVVLALAARAAGMLTLRVWIFSYSAYLLAVAPWNSRSFRYVLLAYPVMWPLVRDLHPRPAARATRVAFVVMVIAGISAQWLWIRYVVTISLETAFIP